MESNPYNWQSHSPTVRIPRDGVDKVADLMRHNGSAVVMGGRGMGKSVFLRQVQAELELEEGTGVILVEGPPAALTIEACLGFLARQLGVSPDPFSSRPMFDEFFAREDAPECLVLLFDEFDRYAEKGASAQPPGRGFFNDLEASRRSLPRLAVVAAGSIGVFVVRDVLGSSFLARALYVPLRPFQRQDATVLISPFAERHIPSEDVLDALFLASGGIPALLTYGFQELWQLDREASLDDVTVAYKTFQREYREYLRDLLSALTDPRLSDAPRRIWDRIQQDPGRLSRAELKAALGPSTGALDLSLEDALFLLEVAGVVRIESSNHDNPVVARPIASLLNLSREEEPAADLRPQFLDDLSWLLARLHRSSVDFFRLIAKSEVSEGRSRLVPEAVFTAHLALGFELLGWRTEREAQRGAGRTDLLLRRNGETETAILELKIWGRNDYRQAQGQVEDYWTDDVAAGAVVQLTDAEIEDWEVRYRRECLEPLGVDVDGPSTTDGSPVRAHFTVGSVTGDGVQVTVDHFLLWLPRRRPPA
ncbi:MAG: AAA family ATPase [Thermoanaerobaculia bacterium]